MKRLKIFQESNYTLHVYLKYFFGLGASLGRKNCRTSLSVDMKHVIPKVYEARRTPTINGISYRDNHTLFICPYPNRITTPCWTVADKSISCKISSACFECMREVQHCSIEPFSPNLSLSRGHTTHVVPRSVSFRPFHKRRQHALRTSLRSP